MADFSSLSGRSFMRRVICQRVCCGSLRCTSLWRALFITILARVNIPVREDCVVSESAISFLFPFGKISSKNSERGVTFLWEKSDIQQRKYKNFWTNFGRGVTKLGGNCDSQWWEMMFFGIFSEFNSATGCRFGYNPGRGANVFRTFFWIQQRNRVSFWK